MAGDIDLIPVDFNLVPIIQSAILLVALVVSVLLVQWWLRKRYADKPGSQFSQQLIGLACIAAAFFVALVALPIGAELRGQLLNLVGIVVSATIALSSTTFVGNAMAGVMLRALRNFSVGDFVEINGHFGRVAERGLFHIEIQTEDRDLTTLPNLYLVQNPVKVIHQDGTIASATVSLGYDVRHDRVEALLMDAAEAVGLTEPFVQITELRDYSVEYRVAGLLSDVRKIISMRSNLRAEIMDSLHADGIEVMSPTQMVTRAIDPAACIIPKQVRPRLSGDLPGVEDVAFDKAERAQSLERLRQRWEAVTAELEQLQAADKAGNESQAKRIRLLEARAKRLRIRLDASSDVIEGLTEKK